MQCSISQLLQVCACNRDSSASVCCIDPVRDTNCSSASALLPDLWLVALETLGLYICVFLVCPLYFFFLLDKSVSILGFIIQVQVHPFPQGLPCFLCFLFRATYTIVLAAGRTGSKSASLIHFLGKGCHVPLPVYFPVPPHTHLSQCLIIFPFSGRDLVCKAGWCFSCSVFAWQHDARKPHASSKEHSFACD